MADPVTIPAGRSGETILIVAILGVGGFIAWRKGLFGRPGPVETPGGPITFKNRLSRPDAALPAVSTVQQAISNVTPPVTDAQKNVLAAEKPPAVASTTGISSAFSSAGDAIAVSRLGTAKPPPVTARPGTTTSSLMAAPSVFGKTFTTAVRPVAAPPAMAPPPAPPPATSVTRVSPVSASPTLIKRVAAPVAPAKPVAKPFPLPVGFGFRR